MYPTPCSPRSVPARSRQTMIRCEPTPAAYGQKFPFCLGQQTFWSMPLLRLIGRVPLRSRILPHRLQLQFGIPRLPEFLFLITSLMLPSLTSLCPLPSTHSHIWSPTPGPPCFLHINLEYHEAPARSQDHKHYGCIFPTASSPNELP